MLNVKRAPGLQMHVTAASKRRWLKYQTMLKTANEVEAFNPAIAPKILDAKQCALGHLLHVT